MIDVHFNSPTVAELQIEMHALLMGHAHRPGPVTNAEIVARAEPVAPNKPASGRTRQTAAEKAAQAASNISTGEERVDPEADKQDAADEAAESKAAAPEPAKLTHDDVKKVLGAHVQAYGMAASQADVKVLLNGAEKLSAIPDTQPALAAAIISIADAIEKNPRKHDIAGDGLEAATVAAITPLVQAARAVK